MTEEIEKVEEKVILVGVSEQDGDDAEDSLAELAELVKTAGAEVVDVVIQKRELIHPGTYVGTGKVEEIAQLLEQTGETGIVCDDELSPAQIKNLESLLAVVSPIEHKFYYYVLDYQDRKRHLFSKNLNEHNILVKKLVRSYKN